MPTTANLLLNIPAHGTEIGTWDVPMNANYNMLDASLGQNSSIAVTNVNITLSGTQYGTGTLIFTGTQTGDIFVTFPALGRVYNVLNLCTGGTNFVIKMRVTAGGATVICAPPGQMIQVFNDTTKLIYVNLPPNVGGYWDIMTDTVPRWVTQCTVPPFLNCDGSVFSAVTYPFLSAYLGGGTTLPDSKGRFRATLNQASGRITTSATSVDGDTLLSGGGSQLVTKQALPSYNLAVTDPSHVHNYQGFALPTWTATHSVDVGTGFPTAEIGTTVAFTGASATNISVALGGSAQTIVPPAYIGGLTLVRAA